MLEYFGFYTPSPENPELEPAQREAVVARAARLGERSPHSPSALPMGRAWERASTREGSSRS
jgi:hypothetical protein